MEKLFISCPMRGRSDAEIKATMEQMHKIAEAVFDTHKAIHYGDDTILKPAFAERRPGDTCPWRK